MVQKASGKADHAIKHLPFDEAVKLKSLRADVRGFGLARAL